MVRNRERPHNVELQEQLKEVFGILDWSMQQAERRAQSFDDNISEVEVDNAWTEGIQQGYLQAIRDILEPLAGETAPSIDTIPDDPSKVFGGNFPLCVARLRMAMKLVSNEESRARLGIAAQLMMPMAKNGDRE